MYVLFTTFQGCVKMCTKNAFSTMRMKCIKNAIAVEFDKGEIIYKEEFSF